MKLTFTRQIKLVNAATRTYIRICTHTHTHESANWEAGSIVREQHVCLCVYVSERLGLQLMLIARCEASNGSICDACRCRSPGTVKTG